MSESVAEKRLSSLKLVLRVLLGATLVVSGVAHLSFARLEFQAQVPAWIPADPGVLVVVSGVIEILLGVGVASGGPVVKWAGLAAAVFFVAAVFPVRVGQYIGGIDAFWFDSDPRRLARLFIEPLWTLWALWSTSAPSLFRRKPREQNER